MQAVCDHEGRFLEMWIKHPASSSDFLTFVRSDFHHMISQPGFLADELVLFGDNAYVTTDYLVSPYKNARDAFHDSFNYFHSQLRINIERAFGILVNRWGVLKKPLPATFTILKQMALALCLCRLHNYCMGDLEVLDQLPQDLRGGISIWTNQNGIPMGLVHGGEHFHDFNEVEQKEYYKTRKRLYLLGLVREQNLLRPPLRRRLN